MKKGAIKDPVLEVEEWKNDTDKQTKRMSPQELNHFYEKAVELIQPKQTAQNE